MYICLSSTGYIPNFFSLFLVFLNAIAWRRDNQTKERKEKHQLQKVLTLTVDTKINRKCTEITIIAC